METSRALTLVCSRVVGNQVPRYSGWKQLGGRGVLAGLQVLETKYRDIADGNLSRPVEVGSHIKCWKPSTAI